MALPCPSMDHIAERLRYGTILLPRHSWHPKEYYIGSHARSDPISYPNITAKRTSYPKRSIFARVTTISDLRHERMNYSKLAGSTFGEFDKDFAEQKDKKQHLLLIQIVGDMVHFCISSFGLPYLEFLNKQVGAGGSQVKQEHITYIRKIPMTRRLYCHGHYSSECREPGQAGYTSHAPANNPESSSAAADRAAEAEFHNNSPVSKCKIRAIDDGGLD
ncbi:hypothetical protein EV127DRAFT_517382 [Xylaria flabelliformis]|nr:hypothetical protein EV127DRAFT_517382 [Xylaria flabelliformis]